MGRTKQKHQCLWCSIPTERYFRVKRKVNYAKLFFCCLDHETLWKDQEARMKKDCQRMCDRISASLAMKSPWLDVLEKASL